MKVWAAAWQHHCGIEFSVFKSFESVESWRQEIADAWWTSEFPHLSKPTDPKACADEYFDRMESEFFSFSECEVEP